jgi:hypothetical protein
VIGPDRSIEPQGSFAEAQAQVCNVLLIDVLVFLFVFVWIQKTTTVREIVERERARVNIFGQLISTSISLD